MIERPIISNAKVNAESKEEEAFQNTVLRPIIKMKSDLLIAFTKHYIDSKKKDLSVISPKERFAYLNSCFEKDHKLRIEVRGMVIGQFSPKEFETYIQMQKPINKRILNIIKERMIDHVELLY